MKRTIVLLICSFIASFVYAGNGVFEGCRDPDGMIGEKCSNRYPRVEPPPYYYNERDEVVSIRRIGDDQVIVTYGDGSYDDLHRRPNGTWGKGLWTDPSSGTTLSK